MDRLFVIARHAESTLNHERRVNGDPAVPVPLTDLGRAEAHELGVQIAHIPIDVCVHTRFGRTRETAEIALAGRDVPLREEPLLDDIDVGELEGKPIDEYRAWKHGHPRSHPFPGGESLDDAAARFADGLERVQRLDADVVFVVTHEIPLRYLLNGAGGSEELDGPVHELRNATPYVFDESALERGIERIRAIVGQHAAEAR
jgi:probable phosphoglycerate mutase